MTARLDVEVVSVSVLRFDDGTPVRAASAVTAYGDGWLVVQDDATSAAWWRGDSITPVRVFPPVDGHDVFSSTEGTKHLKPDLEAATLVPGGVLLLGSGSTDRRMRGALMGGPGEAVSVADLSPLYAAMTRALDIDPTLLNLEGACVVGDVLRWFQRGSASLPSASVDVDLDALLGCFRQPDPGRAADVAVGTVRTYDLGTAEGVPLAVTDAILLDDGAVLVCAAAEDTPNPYDDGPVVGTALALLDDTGLVAVSPLPEVEGRPHKVEGLALRPGSEPAVQVLAVVDADDPELPSEALVLEVRR